jgi:hypothetical protein
LNFLYSIWSTITCCLSLNCLILEEKYSYEPCPSTCKQVLFIDDLIFSCLSFDHVFFSFDKSYFSICLVFLNDKCTYINVFINVLISMFSYGPISCIFVFFKILIVNIPNSSSHQFMVLKLYKLSSQSLNMFMLLRISLFLWSVIMFLWIFWFMKQFE